MIVQAHDRFQPSVYAFQFEDFCVATILDSKIWPA